MSINFLKSSYDSWTVGRDIAKKQVSATGKGLLSSWNFTCRVPFRGGKLFMAVQKQQRSVMEGLPT
jgi:hypothetical protein